MPGIFLSRQEANAARTNRALRRGTSVATSHIPATMSFQIYPYGAVLELSKNDDRKLYLEASKGLKEANLFTGKKTDFDQFSKLMGKSFKDVRVMETLVIPTKWDTTNTYSRKSQPTKDSSTYSMTAKLPRSKSERSPT